ncbi:MAG: molecular chaperone TorD family protein [Rhodospirillaceae bacterium]|jgi:TorA maturation chaperone TorD|nr:molecular chaperone TorD family protein [Rhodospirillaceae bacterium]MBT6135921.1 molecular chaperone TorD family protein [Rhodospirillaceae bacterium]
MSVTEAAATTTGTISDEDLLRSHWYRLLARLLEKPPSLEVMALARGLAGDDTPFGEAVSALAKSAEATTVETLDTEYHELFYGVGRGELVPHLSYYLTGFLNEKPLGQLRADMARLGIARADGVSEPEDHMAQLCDMMAGLILGEFDEPVGEMAGKTFFDAHVGPWAVKFFEDLEGAQASSFYMPVGRVGRLFMEIEAQAYEMAN